MRPDEHHKPNQLIKHDRSRGNRVRQPKKGGAGGKGTWGKPGQNDLVNTTVDRHDPNYDESGGVATFSILEPSLALNATELQHVMDPILYEFFENGDTNEVLECCLDSSIPPYQRFHVAVHAVVLSLDRHDGERELVSRLLSDLYPKFFTSADIQSAFTRILEDIRELTVDVPDAPEMLAKFLARCVADDCMPPSYLVSVRSNDTAFSNVLKDASVKINQKHGLVRLDSVWGVDGRRRPVKTLVSRIILLLKEFIISRDAQEAERCVLELDCHHFHHEVIYEAIILAITDEANALVAVPQEDSTTGTVYPEPREVSRALCSLLAKFYKENIIVSEQLAAALKRVTNDLDDIAIDVPSAYIAFETIVRHAVSIGLAKQAAVDAIPSRGRKRFISQSSDNQVKA